MNTTISGKMQYLDDLKILMLNNLPYNDCSDFHIKKTDELLNVIKEHKPYINKITFYLVSSYNSGEASFLYDIDDIYFVIFDVELSTIVLIIIEISAGILANALISFAVEDIPESLFLVVLAKF